MRIGIALLSISLSFWVAGCRTQRQHGALVAPARPAAPDGLLADALANARANGYRSVSVDEQRYVATFVAHYGSFEGTSAPVAGPPCTPGTNYFRVRVLRGAILVEALGADVRGRRIDRTLQWELDVFAARVAGRDPHSASAQRVPRHGDSE